MPVTARAAEPRFQNRNARKIAKKQFYCNQLAELAGAGGFEPPYGGIKIRCLTTWLRPNRYRKAAYKRFCVRPPDHSGVDRHDQRPPLIHIHMERKRALTGLGPGLD